MKYAIPLILLTSPAYAQQVEGNISATVVDTVVTMHSDGTVDGQEPLYCEYENQTFTCFY